MSPLRAECGSSHCQCDHASCEVGWFPTLVRSPSGEYSEAMRKCPECFPQTPPPPPPPLHLRDARELGAKYADHAAAAAGDKDDDD